MATTAQPKRSPRERLLAAANELFYHEGVQTVGIDRIIEHAGVAKASLYNTFGSKEELVRAYLESRHGKTMDRLTRAVAARTEPRARLLAVFDSQTDLFARPDFHGCAFASASAEAPRGGLVEQATDTYRGEIRALLAELAAQAGVPDPAALARQLHLVYDGATLSARMDRDPSVAAVSRATAEALLDAALPPARRD
ncbi:MAG TPA: TetR/AcrR family transcriptional regulator [Pseudonocardiaceae bacterium]